MADWKYGLFTSKEEHQDYNKYDVIFDIIKSYNFKAPSESYSFLLKSFIKISEVWQGFLDFADWWNLEHLRKEDFLMEEYKGRKTLPCLLNEHT